ncbi:uncharacterized protein LOC129971965 [Argiope bruennichi]|uniref:uncharacterized protein LOC129971965 n=1 Tax=Argiope bruennichi TaxID=94029 RepID=UPI00249459FD|nr:uncharacterized protein LOC129971965 [Argiope bruennichi]
MIYYEDGHSCFSKEKPEENICVFDFLKLEELADELEEAAKTNQECTSDEKNYQCIDSRSVSKDIDETVCSEASFDNCYISESDSLEIIGKIHGNSSESKRVSEMNHFQAAPDFALRCSERNEDAIEALKQRDCKKLRCSFAEPVQVDSYVRGEFASDDYETLISVVDIVPISGPSEINIKPQRKDIRKVLVCYVCNIRYSRQNYLQKHSRTHTGEKHY